MSQAGHTTEALVLRGADSFDDKIVHLLTPDLGRVPAAARNARASKRRTGAHLDVLARIEVLLLTRADRHMARILEVRALEVFPVVRGDLLRFALATTMLEVVLGLLPEHGQEPGTYELLLRALRHLDRPETSPTEDLLLLFELRMLTLFGLLPPIEALSELSDDARAVVSGWQYGRWHPLDPADRRPLRRVLEALIEDSAGRPLRSRAFLDEMLGSQASSPS